MSTVGLAVVSAVLALLAAEMAARILRPRSAFNRLMAIPGEQTTTVDGVELWRERVPRYTSDDLRRAAADASAFRILGLGDSIMYGVGQEKEQTYLEQARRSLALRSHRTIETINLAVPGYNTLQEDAAYKEIAAQIQPDLVVVHYWADDIHRYRFVGGYVVNAGDISEDGYLVLRALPLPARLSDFLLLNSRLYEMLMQVAVVHGRDDRVPDWWSLVAKPLAAIQQRVQDGGGRLLVLASVSFEDGMTQPNGDLRQLREFGEQHRVEVIDLSEWLAGVDATRIAMDGCHFNAEGHRILGERFADYLLAHDLKEGH